jgi:hypothetical protein
LNTALWFELGIVTPERLQAMNEEWDRGEDKNPEHYRWHAFMDFLEEARPLTEELAAALYELGRRDPDFEMGGSMMGQILRLPECPAAIVDSAARSGRKHLERLAARRGEM